jgi:predicted XRE-type DNA-binding protein
MTRTKETIIGQLRQAIADSGESQNAISKATGIAQPHLNRFVNEERGLSLENAAVLCSYLKLHLAPISRKR